MRTPNDIVFDDLLLDVSGPIARITLDRPGQLNALTPTLIESLVAALTIVKNAPGIRILILTGSGRGFCAGADMEKSDWAGDDPEAKRRSFDRAYAIPRLLRCMPFPVVAAVNGPAAGAGISLVAASDYRVAGDTAFFKFGFTRLGLIPDLGLTVLLPELVGASRALELVLNDERVTADEALALGLVSSVVPADALRDEVDRIAEHVASLAPLAVGATKALLYRRSLAELDQGLHLEGEAQRALHETDDFHEGLVAYAQRRPPSFLGR